MTGFRVCLIISRHAVMYAILYYIESMFSFFFYQNGVCFFFFFFFSPCLFFDESVWDPCTRCFPTFLAFLLHYIFLYFVVITLICLSFFFQLPIAFPDLLRYLLPCLTFLCCKSDLYFLDLPCFCFFLTSYFALTLFYSSFLVCFLSCFAAYPVTVSVLAWSSLLMLLTTFLFYLHLHYCLSCLPWFVPCFFVSASIFQLGLSHVTSSIIYLVKLLFPACFLLNSFLLFNFFICRSLVIYRSFAYRS